ncbi:complex I NDUFA9 subunit family protein [Paracoccaceae bacterium GXU_MW_L88]
MDGNAPIAVVFGGSGFLGRYIVKRLADRGWRVRVATRRPHEAGFVRPYGYVGQVEPFQCNLRYPESVAAMMLGADAVVNCVGILNSFGKNDFESVQEEGAATIAELASKAGITRMVHVSAIGADAESESIYAQTKASGEAAVQKYMPSAVILRPSILFGAEDGFFNKFAGMARMMPVLPVTAADTKFQPVYVDDVAAAAVNAIIDGAKPGIYELGGPEIKSFRELMEQMLDVIMLKRPVINMPTGLMKIQAGVLDMAQKLSFGLFENTMITRDQITLLNSGDNVVAADMPGLTDLGVSPVAMETVLESYLYRFRKEGQYTEMTQSAKNLRQN